MTQEETITISRKYYEHLVERNNWLECLEAAGVDNWDGWDEAAAMMNEEE